MPICLPFSSASDFTGLSGFTATDQCAWRSQQYGNVTSIVGFLANTLRNTGGEIAEVSTLLVAIACRVWPEPDRLTISIRHPSSS